MAGNFGDEALEVKNARNKLAAALLRAADEKSSASVEALETRARSSFRPTELLARMVCWNRLQKSPTFAAPADPRGVVPFKVTSRSMEPDICAWRHSVAVSSAGYRPQKSPRTTGFSDLAR